MTVLGIDVGLKNLSLCIMSKNDKQYDILLWGNYNLLDKDPEICLGKKLNGQNCTRIGIFRCGTEHYCKIHSKGLIVKPVAKCKKVQSYLIQDIARIVLAKITELYSENTDIFNLVTRCFIENQPKINNKMKVVSTLILGKLTELLSPKVSVRFISANAKLGIGNLVSCNTSRAGTRGKSGYACRKKLSIEYTRSFLHNGILNDREKWIENFEKSKKLDDMADSLGFCIHSLK